MTADWKKFEAKSEEPAQGRPVLVTDINGAVGLGTRVNAAGFTCSGCLSHVTHWAELPAAAGVAK